MRTIMMLMPTVVTILGAGAPLRAHHAFAAEFDAKKPVKLQGTVTKVEWIQPARLDSHRREGADGIASSSG
jgi:ABC-type hemin transport system substrate-binding protein